METQAALLNLAVVHWKEAKLGTTNQLEDSSSRRSVFASEQPTDAAKRRSPHSRHLAGRAADLDTSARNARRYAARQRMNKQVLISEVAACTGYSRRETERVIEAVLSEIGNALRKREMVRLTGFGTFSVTTRKPSSGRNPRSGKTIQIPPVPRPKFVPSGLLKNRVRQGS
jgi:DNA-binding protein HU-beta